MDNPSEILRAICQALLNQNIEEARDSASRLPVPDRARAKRMNPSKSLLMRVFVRDGFIDRYSGARLVLPAALRIISERLPQEFPYHPNWKHGLCHPVYWELSATVDHIIPVASDGTQEESNLVTTSMLRNLQKSTETIEDLDWSLKPTGDFGQWDGLTGLYIKLVQQDQSILGQPYFKGWYRAAVKVTGQ